MEDKTTVTTDEELQGEIPLLERIRQVESSSRELVAGAEAEAVRRLRAARQRAEELVTEAERAARDEAAAMIAEAEEEGRRRAEEHQRSADKELEREIEEARGRLAVASRLLTRALLDPRADG